MANRSLNIALVGATGAVGREVLSILEGRSLSVGRLELLASSRSVGEELLFNNRTLRVSAVSPRSFDGIDVVLGATSDEVAEAWVPLAEQVGATVIDTSPAYRLVADVPLVVPEVNADALTRQRARRIIATPGGATVPLAVTLRPLQKAAGLRRVVVSAFLSTSGAGQRGMEALSQEVLRLYRRGDIYAQDEDTAELEPIDSPFPHQVAFNAIPHVGAFLPDGNTTEERALVEESRKVLEQPDLRIAATCVRAPWFACYALSVNLEMEKPLSAEEARSLLGNAPGVVLEDEPRRNLYPMPFAHAGADAVYVGRVRRDLTVENGLSLWIVADNIRKGAALNAIQVLEALPGLR